MSIEDLFSEGEDTLKQNQQEPLSTKELNELVDKMIKEINKQFKKELKDEVTRNEIMYFIRNNYGDYLKIEKVETIIDNDLQKFKRDCHYWLFILVPTYKSKERIYITI